MNTKIRVSGNIIGELSEKIPSNIIALNELIKNAYDAGASEVLVTINTSSKKLVIKDNGCGMDEEDIETLFHISISKKMYGEINEFGRHTQGSKGLGFLSVFKFGNTVKWKTKKNKGLEFNVNYTELLKCEDISEYTVIINNNEELSIGTEIEIDLNNYNLENLPEYLNQEKNFEKVINAFDDENFIIQLEIDSKTYSNKNRKRIKDYIPERQLYYVLYSSENEKIKFYYKDKLVIEKEYGFKSSKYKLNMELLIFSFKPNDKSKINKLFYDNFDDLTPITYINDNLFNNYELFNPGIFKNKKSSDVLNQMIGYIRIESNDKDMAFNSDRSQFLQNELTDEIKDFLHKINIEIQGLGVEYKKYLRKNNGENFLKPEFTYEQIQKGNLTDAIQDNFELKEFVEIEDRDDEIVYRIFENEQIIKKDKTNNKEEIKYNLAIINLKNKKIRLEVNSNQYNLLDEIKTAKDSMGNDIKNKVKVMIDGMLNPSKILPSCNSECTKKIDYIYEDPNTGRTSANLSVEFYIPSSSMKTIKRKEKIIQLDFLKVGYTLKYDVYVEKIHKEINDLTEQFDNYKELIACSLRPIFEISADTIRKSEKYGTKFASSDLKTEITNILQYIASNNSYIGAIATSSGIGFKNLKKILNISDFEDAIDKAHMGAHKSTMDVTDLQIKNLAKMAGYFMVVVNEMINNSKIL